MSACREPLADGLLLDWWAGETVRDRRRVEEHLLGCGDCVARVELLQRVGGGIAALLRGGELPVVIAPVVLDRLRRDGLRIREYAVPAGGGVHCTVGPDDDLLLARLAVDLDGVTRLDLLSSIDGGAEERLPELPFDPGSGELLLLPPVELIRAWPARVQRFSLVAVAAGFERVLGRYEFHHSPWQPGEGS